MRSLWTNSAALLAVCGGLAACGGGSGGPGEAPVNTDYSALRLAPSGEDARIATPASPLLRNAYATPRRAVMHDDAVFVIDGATVRGALWADVKL